MDLPEEFQQKFVPVSLNETDKQIVRRRFLIGMLIGIGLIGFVWLMVFQTIIPFEDQMKEYARVFLILFTGIVCFLLYKQFGELKETGKIIYSGKISDKIINNNTGNRYFIINDHQIKVSEIVYATYSKGDQVVISVLEKTGSILKHYLK